jgi:predicted DNA-binding transcriptional regulator AlpA
LIEQLLIFDCVNADDLPQPVELGLRVLWGHRKRESIYMMMKENIKEEKDHFKGTVLATQ